jgi:hypothetical protein
MFRGSNSSEVDFPHTPKTGAEVQVASYTIGTRSFLWVKQPELGVKLLPYLAPRVKRQ